MFKTSDLSLNQYHHVFFQVAPETPRVLTTHMYDNAMNSLGTLDTSFGDHNIVDILTAFDQGGTNPFVLGTDHVGSYKRNMDIGFFGLYNRFLKPKQQQSLMKYTNQKLLEPHSQATIYMVTAAGGKFFVNGEETPYLLMNPGIHVFDQRGPTNATHPLRFSETEDGIHAGSSGTEYTTGVVVNGTPGSINAYTLIHVTESTPDLYYYCENHSGMGSAFSNIDLIYYVKVVQNALGENVYAFSTTANGTYYNQMELSFVAGEQYLFNVGHASNDGYRLEFGTTVDDITTINTANVIRDDDTIVLDLNDYQGDALVYFEDTSAGMGYVEATGITIGSWTSNYDNGGKWSKVIYQDGLYVAVSRGGTERTATSSDAVNWTLKAVGTRNWYGLAYGAGKYVACAYDGYVMYSSDANTWTEVNYAGGWHGITYANNKFVMVGTGGKIANSTDGVNWITIVNTNNSDHYWGMLTYGNNTFVAVSVSDPIVTTSTDGGATWDIYNTGFYFSETNVWGDITYNGNNFIVTNKSNTSTGVMTSPDGVNWTLRTTPVSIWRGIASYNGFVVAVSRSGKIMTSSDHGITWTLDTEITGPIFEGITYGGNKFVALDQGATSDFWVSNGHHLVYTYTVTVSGDPAVFYIDGTLQLQIDFVADTTYVFDQSDPLNAGYQIVFGLEPDAESNYITGKTIMGSPGQPGAYTQIDLSADFVGPLFYYHDTISYMGYGPMTLSTDLASVISGDVVTFTITNRTGIAEIYTITGVASEDISGADLSGSIGYGQQVDLSYTITCNDKTMVFSVGDLSANVTIANLISYEFAVQDNALGDPVFAVYDTEDSAWYNQPDLSFVAPNVYEFDLSSSIVDGGYTLVFGTEVDKSGTVVDTRYVTRETDKVILDLREYNVGQTLVYFEDSSAGMGYMEPQTGPRILENWQQLGVDIDGEAANDWSGISCSMSDDGKRVAIGAWFNNGSGHVRVYRYDSTNWVQLGSDIDGEAAGDAFGRRVSISADGNTFVASVHGIGRVRVYRYNSTSWEKLGSDLESKASGDGLGSEVSISADGNTIAAGAPGNDDNGTGSGHVRVYRYNGTAWVQLGLDIGGEAEADGLKDCSLSADGNTIAVGATGNDDNGDGSGHVRVYQYSIAESGWVQLGSDIDGEAAGDVAGVCSLSADGNTVAVSGPDNDANGENSGHVRVYNYSVAETAWVQLGLDIRGEAAGDKIGDRRSTSISADGLTVAIGGYYNDGNGSNSGHARVFRYIGTEWVQLGVDIDGEAAGDYFGYECSLSSDGNTVAISALLNNGNGNDSGHVRVFTIAEDIQKVEYMVTVSGDPAVFDLSGTLQLQIDFVAGTTYVFDQSDPLNAGYQIVFGLEPDTESNYITGKTIMGSPGQPGAYTQIDLSADFVGPLFYYHDTISYMGYGPMTLSTDLASVISGDVVTFTITNRTGIAEIYTITGVASEDISGADLSGSIGYGQQVDLSYTITCNDKTMVFSVGDLSANVTIANLISYEFAVQDNALGDPVFAVYDTDDAAWYNQPDLSFVAPNMYEFDLSSSIVDGGYTLVFGTEVDKSGTVVDTRYVTRETDKVILDLREYNVGQTLVYFEDSSAGMGYVSFESLKETVEIYTNPPNSQRSYSGYYIDGTIHYDKSPLLDPPNHFVCWVSLTSGHQIKVDLENPSTVLGVRVQGRQHHQVENEAIQYVTKYKVEYSQDDATYTSVDSEYEFDGSDGTMNIINAYFSVPVVTRYIKIIPSAFSGTTAMTFGLIEEAPNYTVYSVTVSGDPDVFYIDGSPNPQIDFTAGETYIFDQSDSTNNKQLVLGTIPDLSSSMISYQTVVGTPGQPGAYTTFTATEETVYYFSYETPDMGYEPPPPPPATNFTNTSVLSGWYTNYSGKNNYSYTLSGNSNTFANGLYTIKVSSDNPTYGGYSHHVMNSGSSGYGGYDWITNYASDHKYNSSNDGVYEGTVTTNGISGEWIEIQMPYAMRINSMQIIGRVALPTNSPEILYIFGSNDNGNTFTQLHNETGLDQVSFTIQITGQTESFSLLRMVVNKLQGGGDVNLEYWAFTGDVYVS